METYFKIIEIIVHVLNINQHYNTKLTYQYIAGLCIKWNLTKNCYIFELSHEGYICSLYTPYGKQILNIPNNFITKSILGHFTFEKITNTVLLITHINSQPIFYPTGITLPDDYFIPNSVVDYSTNRQNLDDEIKRLVSSYHLTDDFGALDQLVSNPQDYSIIIDIVGNQNTVSITKKEIEQYMSPSKFIYLHLFELIIMSQSNIYV
jgi:hypothetical protein